MDEYEISVQEAVQRAVLAGKTNLTEALRYCEGADPRLIDRILKQELAAPARANAADAAPDPMESFLSVRMPAADPFRSQWWFTGAAIRRLSSVLESVSAAAKEYRVLCLGAPSVARHLTNRGFSVHVLDVDPHVLDALRPLRPRETILEYDAADDLPPELKDHFDGAIIDPPWYDSAIRSFIARTLAALREGGHFICTLPPRLTRPGIDKARADLISDLTTAGYELLSLQTGIVEYLVPRFEAAALENLSFPALPWRFGDLMHVRKTKGGINPLKPSLKRVSIRSYSRRANEFRVFVRDSQSASADLFVEKLPGYSTNISTRAHPDEEPDVWSSEKVGLRVSDSGHVELALIEWASKKDEAGTVNELASKGLTERDASQLVTLLDKHLQLWSHFASSTPLRSDEQIAEIKKTTLMEWATDPSNREHGDEKDNYRAWYQRDRDRVLWSTGFRRLSNKTQLFPVVRIPAKLNSISDDVERGRWRSAW